jgi:hypothetical protein
MTIATKKCKEENECDTRYILREWLWRGITILVIGFIGVIYATGTFVAQTKMSIETIKADITTLQKMNTNVDSIKEWTRK